MNPPHRCDPTVVAPEGEEVVIAPGSAKFSGAGWSGTCIVTETATEACMSRQEPT